MQDDILRLTFQPLVVRWFFVRRSLAVIVPSTYTRAFHFAFLSHLARAIASSIRLILSDKHHSLSRMSFDNKFVVAKWQS